MANAQRDENRIPVGLAVSDTDGETTLPLYLDSATNRLLIEIEVVTDNVGTLPAQPAIRDQNNVPVSLAVTDDANETPTPLLIDSRNGFLYLDVLIE